jgi:type IV secretion system protein VirD4
MQFEGSVLAVDIKGDIYNYVSKHSNRKILRFTPDADDALSVSCHFDPLYGFDEMTPTDQKLYLENVASILIADKGGNEGNYFSTRARKLFQGISHLILFKNPDASFPDIIHAILEGNVFDWVNEALESDCRASKELLASFYGNSEKNVSGAYDALTTALISFSNPILDELMTRSEKSVSIKDLDDGYDIYLQISQEHLNAYAPLFTLLLQSFSTAFTKRPDSSTGIQNRPILMLMDEFPQLTFSYQMINTNLSTLRSKSVICMVIQQNLAQLSYRYGQDGARSILGNCNYQIILGSNDIQSSEQFSRTFGMKRILKVSNSITQAEHSSFGRSIQEMEVRVYPAEYFGDLPSLSKMIVYCKGKYIELTKLNCYKK